MACPARRQRLRLRLRQTRSARVAARPVRSAFAAFVHAGSFESCTVTVAHPAAAVVAPRGPRAAARSLKARFPPHLRTSRRQYASRPTRWARRHTHTLQRAERRRLGRRRIGAYSGAALKETEKLCGAAKDATDDALDDALDLVPAECAALTALVEPVGDLVKDCVGDRLALVFTMLLTAVLFQSTLESACTCICPPCPRRLQPIRRHALPPSRGRHN